MSRKMEGTQLVWCMVLFVSFCAGLCQQCGNPNIADASDYVENSFLSLEVENKTLTLLTVHSDNIYTAGNNGLFHLSQDLEVESKLVTEGEENIYKILDVSESLGKLVACSSGGNRGCQLRNLDDVSVNSSSTNTAFHENVVASGAFRTVGMIAPGKEGEGSSLYVARSIDLDGGDTVIRDPAVFERKMMGNGNDDRQTNVMHSGVKTSFVIYYSDVFSYDGFVYYLASQRDDATKEDSPVISKLSRVCQNDADEDLKAFAELQLACVGKNSTLYSITQSAKWIGNELFIVFNRNGEELSEYYDPQPQSALCVYNMTEIEDRFEENSYACGCDDGDSTDKSNNNYLSLANCGLLAENTGFPGCGTLGFTRDKASCASNIGTTKFFAYPEEPEGQAVSAEALYESSGSTFSSLSVTSVPRDDSQRIAFIGTKEGKLLKVNLNQASCNYEVVDIGSAILDDTTLYNNNESLLVLTESKILKMKVADCSQFTTCDECIRPGSPLGDPYCGWCTLEKRCTRYDECQNNSESSRWLPYDEAECVAIAEVTPKALAREVDSQELQLRITHLPELKDGQHYTCRFNDWETEATVSGSHLNCTSPPENEIPDAPNESADHVIMQLHIYSSETGKNFVTRDYEFYDCSRIQSCSECVNSKWRCDWCKFEHRCTHDSSGCRIAINGSYGSPSNTSSESCPQILPGEIKLVPSDVEETFQFQAKNLPPIEDDAVQKYECHLTAKDNCCAEVDFVTMATLNTTDNVSFIVTCDPKAYSYMQGQQTLDTKLSLKWNSDNLVDNYQPVQLYKCEVDRPDCSRCLSPVTTPLKLNCVWCEDTCTVADTCDRQQTLPESGTCPDPQIDTVNPPTSTLGGGTHVTITGSNLGQAFDDIKSIILAGEKCKPLQDSYMVGESITCEAGPADVVTDAGDITVRVGEQTGTKANCFSYKDPMITVFAPKRGPQSGGTQVEIKGTDLDTGGSVEVTIGDVPCRLLSSRTAVNISCKTEAAESTFASSINITFDKTASKTSGEAFSFEEDPTVTTVDPLKAILSGGTNLAVTGTNFDLIQRPQIVATTQEGTEIYADCSRKSKTELQCPSPKLSQETSRKRRQTENTPEQNVVIGFLLDGVTSLKNWTEDNDVTFEYFADPTYAPFKNNEMVFNQGTQETIQIMGKNIDVATNQEDVTVYIGKEKCKITVFDENQIYCTPPGEQPAAGDIDGNRTERGLPYVVVQHGANLKFFLGYIRYSTDPILYIIIAICFILVLIVIVAALIIYCMRQSKNKEVESLLLELRDVRTNISEELRILFAMLQTAMDKFETTTEVLPLLPLIDRSQYVKNMLFLNLSIQPTTEPPMVSEVEDAMKKFSELISNKSFLLVFIRTLDEEKNLPVMDRVNIASLITLALLLEGKLDYLTDVMLTLTSEHIEDLVDKNRPRQLLKRTESIVEKLVSNWIAICLYDYLQTDAAEKIVQLYGAIKTVVEKGPIDAVSGKSQFSLSDEHMLESHIQFEEVTLQVVANEEDGEIASVSVLNVDTITQVKNKILDHLHRGRPYSSRPLASDMDLEWRQGLSGQLVLRDEGVDTEVKEGWKKVNTLNDYRVENGCRVALIKKQAHPNAQLSNRAENVAERIPASALRLSLILLKAFIAVIKAGKNVYFPGRKLNYMAVIVVAHITDLPMFLTYMSDISETSYLQPNAAEKQPLHRSPTLVEARVEEGVSLWHLIKEIEGSDDIQHKSKSKKRRLQKKGIKEVLLPLLPATRNALQKYVDGAFDVMLSTDQNQVPKCIKYLFDFFDRQATKHNVDAPEIVNAWKNNVLPLRFWTTIMANPTYIFDVRRSRYVEACLRVLVQVLRDACSKSDFKLNKDSSPSRLLYASLLPKYTEQVERYYQHIQDIPRLNPDASKEEFSRICKPFEGIFDPVSTMYQLYQFAKRFNEPLNAALEADDDCQNANLSYRMEQVRITLNE